MGLHVFGISWGAEVEKWKFLSSVRKGHDNETRKRQGNVMMEGRRGRYGCDNLLDHLGGIVVEILLCVFFIFEQLAKLIKFKAG